RFGRGQRAPLRTPSRPSVRRRGRTVARARAWRQVGCGANFFPIGPLPFPFLCFLAPRPGAVRSAFLFRVCPLFVVVGRAGPPGRTQAAPAGSPGPGPAPAPPLASSWGAPLLHPCVVCAGEGVRYRPAARPGRRFVPLMCARRGGQAHSLPSPIVWPGESFPSLVLGLGARAARARQNLSERQAGQRKNRRPPARNLPSPSFLAAARPRRPAGLVTKNASRVWCLLPGGRLRVLSFFSPSQGRATSVATNAQLGTAPMLTRK
ncbi:unnamed protein product, partial [Amoebophrya sp. A120]